MYEEEEEERRRPKGVGGGRAGEEEGGYRSIEAVDRPRAFFLFRIVSRDRMKTSASTVIGRRAEIPYMKGRVFRYHRAGKCVTGAIAPRGTTWCPC